jgi:uroporphyrinogen decarboxylase
MTASERVRAALTGAEVDRPPVSLWQHFPERDQSAEQLAESTGSWQEQLGLDFIKLMPPGDYATIDWGLTSEYRGARGGTRDTTRFPVQSVDDWRSIMPVAAERGFNGEMVRGAGLASAIVGPEVPVLQTIFSPLTIASKLSDGRVVEHLRANPDAIHAALHVIRDVTIDVARASLRAGARGVFFASQLATSDLLTEEEYLEFGANYDLEVLEEANDGGSEFTLVHIHGANTFFHLLAGYPAHALNWHDRRIGPDIPTVQRTYPDRACVAGIDEHGIAEMTPDDVRAQVREARAATGDRGLLIGPGCVILTATPRENLLAAVEAATERGNREQGTGGSGE